MGARHRRSMQVRRKGRHRTPSQVEKVAEKAGRAAPAMACAGVIAAVPATHDLSSARHATVAAQAAPAHLDATTTPAHAGFVSAGSSASTGSTASAHIQVGHTYTVRAGDTLSSISQRSYSNSADWPWLAHENSSTVQNPNAIDTGQRLNIPADPPSNASSMSWYQPKHAASAPAAGSRASSSPATATNTAASSAAGLSGSLGCSALESLWKDAGGNPANAVLAASIAMAESSGNQFATGSAGEEGYWQINPVNGDATYDPLGNAHAAVGLSANGTNWSAWTTFTTGAYMGKC